MSNSFIRTPQPEYALIINNQSGPIVRLRYDGKVEVLQDGGEPEAAKIFYDQMQAFGTPMFLAAERLQQVTAERDALRAEVERARADERQAMHWLATVRDAIHPALSFDQLRAGLEALQADALRWRHFRAAGGDLTLRLHNARSDTRDAIIDTDRAAAA